MAHIVFICSHFRTQGTLTTDCDGSARHRKWQEPAGTLLMALTAYNCSSFASLGGRVKGTHQRQPGACCVLTGVLSPSNDTAKKVLKTPANLSRNIMVCKFAVSSQLLVDPCPGRLSSTEEVITTSSKTKLYFGEQGFLVRIATEGFTDCLISCRTELDDLKLQVFIKSVQKNARFLCDSAMKFHVNHETLCWCLRNGGKYCPFVGGFLFLWWKPCWNHLQFLILETNAVQSTLWFMIRPAKWFDYPHQKARNIIIVLYASWNVICPDNHFLYFSSKFRSIFVTFCVFNKWLGPFLHLLVCSHNPVFEDLRDLFRHNSAETLEQDERVPLVYSIEHTERHIPTYT